tara:strand:- start:116 stop:901 length:786 start_codon:yes stop_codon:yes gene_type:complete
MKHKLLLCILILVVVALYCQNCIEHLENSENSENSKNKLIKIINNIIKNKLQKIYGEFIDAKINQKLHKIECKQGPQGPKGDVGDKTTSYQGLYCQEDSTQPISFNIGTAPVSKNIVILRPSVDENNKPNNFFSLTNKERWQYTQSNEIVSAYMNKSNNKETGDKFTKNYYRICYEDNNVFMCNPDKDNKKDNSQFNSQFNYTNDNEFKTTQGKSSMCLTLGSLIDPANEVNEKTYKGTIKKQLKLSECQKDNQSQKFFLH